MSVPSNSNSDSNSRRSTTPTRGQTSPLSPLSSSVDPNDPSSFPQTSSTSNLSPNSPDSPNLSQALLDPDQMSATKSSLSTTTLLHHRGPSSNLILSLAHDPSAVKSPVVDLFDPFTRFSTSSKSVKDIASWLKTHKSNADAMADIRHFEERTQQLYDLEHSRNEAWHIYKQTAFDIQRRKEDFTQEMSALRRSLQSEDQASKDQASKKQEHISSEAAKAEDLKTVIVARIKEGDLEQVGAALLLHNPVTHPIAVQNRGQTQLTLKPSSSIFRFSAIKPDGMLEDLEGQDDDTEEDGHTGKRSWSDVTLTIDPPYWRLYRDQSQGIDFFVAPKTEDQRVKSEVQEKMWVREETAADIFLQLGWLVEKSKDGPEQMTRYVVALNLSTNPFSMWLIYDYRQPDDMGHLYTAKVPAVGEPDLYMDPVSEVASGKEKEEVRETYKGYLDQLEPWDLACLYQDAPRDWPKDGSSAAAAAAAAVAAVAAGVGSSPSFLRFGAPDRKLRAKRIKPTAI